MYKLVTEIFDAILPRVCPGCGSQLEVDDSYICSKCILEINLPDAERIETEYKRNFESAGLIKDFRALYVFEKDKAIQNIIHSIKYLGKYKVGEYLGTVAGKQFNEQLKQWNIDFIIPVPLHPVKKAERGYNQSYYIAKGVSKSTGIPLKTNLLKRTKYTDTQTHMTRLERDQNISGAFKSKRNILPANYLIVDDVCTTGATFNECAKVLKQKGASNVYALSLAIAE